MPRHILLDTLDGYDFLPPPRPCVCDMPVYCPVLAAARFISQAAARHLFGDHGLRAGYVSHLSSHGLVEPLTRRPRQTELYGEFAPQGHCWHAGPACYTLTARCHRPGCSGIYALHPVRASVYAMHLDSIAGRWCLLCGRSCTVPVRVRSLAIPLAPSLPWSRFEEPSTDLPGPPSQLPFFLPPRFEAFLAWCASLSSYSSP